MFNFFQLRENRYLSNKTYILKRDHATSISVKYVLLEFLGMGKSLDQKSYGPGMFYLDMIF